MSVLAKCAQALDVLEREARPVRLIDLAQELDMPKSSAHRIMSDLTDLRFVRRNESGSYLLGPRLMGYGQVALTSFDLRAPAMEPIRALCAETGESVHLYVPEGNHRICLGEADGRYSIRPAVRLGRPLPLGSGAAGRVLYAFASDEVVAQVQAEAERDGRTLPSSEEVAVIRREHWATSFGEREAGLAAGASSVLDGSGRVVGALSIGGSQTRLDPARLEELRPLVYATSRKISENTYSRVASFA